MYKEDLEVKSKNNDLRSQPVMPPAGADAPDKDRPYRLTAEVTVFCIIFCSAMTGGVMYDLLSNRTCTHTLGHSEEFCAQLKVLGVKPQEVRDLETAVQQYTVTINTVKSLLDGLVPAALALFLGAWSNKHGRKPLLLWPAFGYAFSTALALIYSSAGVLGPWWYIATSLPYALAGGSCAFYTGSFCLLSDLSSTKNRTLRLVILQTAIFSGIVMGSLSATYVHAALGTNNVLIIALCVSTFGLVFTTFFVPEPIHNAKKGGILSIFSISSLKDAVRTCFMKRSNYGRAIIICLALANYLELLTTYGLTPIEYLYVRQKLEWTLHDQSIFTAINTTVMMVGLLIGVMVLQRVFQLSDSLISLISFVASLVEALIRANVTATWMMYLGSAVCMFRGLSFSVIRSILTKRVEATDIAKIFAFIATADAFLPLLAPLPYNMVYRLTLATLPGAVYYITAGIIGICCVLMGAGHFLIVRYPSQEEDTL